MVALTGAHRCSPLLTGAQRFSAPRRLTSRGGRRRRALSIGPSHQHTPQVRGAAMEPEYGALVRPEMIHCTRTQSGNKAALR